MSPNQTPPARDPRKESAQVSMMSGGVAVVIGAALFVFGSPARPGERRNALFLALEQMLGYHGAVGLFIGAGLALLLHGIWRYRGAARDAAP